MPGRSTVHVAPGTETVPPRRGAIPTDPDALRAFYDRPKEQRLGFALCLSGGGFRASLFHLGALRRLNELGILCQIDVISAVSGGSILAAHLAERIGDAWPTPQEVDPDGPDIPAPAWADLEARFLALTRRDLRTGPLVRRFALPVPGWFTPSTAVNALAEKYRRYLTDKTLAELPPRPEYIFGASELKFGRYWTFQHDYAGSPKGGSFRPSARWTVARAVAASSCFPPLFDPMHVAKEEFRGVTVDDPDQVEDLHLSDGGVIDNTGYAAVWDRCDRVLVSDGGGQFQYQWKDLWVWRFLRYTSIVDARGRASQRTWILSNLITRQQTGAYWSIGSDPHNYPGWERQAYSPGFVDGYIHRVRTDLNPFSSEEQAVLMNHGYLLADAAVRCHAPHLARRPDAPLVVPNQTLLENQDRARAALAWSHSSWDGPRLYDGLRRRLDPIWPYHPEPRRGDRRTVSKAS